MGDFWSMVALKRSEHIRRDIEEAARLAGLPVHNIAEELIERGDR